MSDKENASGLETEDVFKFYAFQRQNVPEAFPEFHKDTPSGKGGAKGLQVLALLLLLLLASKWQPAVWSLSAQMCCLEGCAKGRARHCRK